MLFSQSLRRHCCRRWHAQQEPRPLHDQQPGWYSHATAICADSRWPVAKWLAWCKWLKALVLHVSQGIASEIPNAAVWSIWQSWWSANAHRRWRRCLFLLSDELPLWLRVCRRCQLHSARQFQHPRPALLATTKIPLSPLQWVQSWSSDSIRCRKSSRREGTLEWKRSATLWWRWRYWFAHLRLAKCSAPPKRSLWLLLRRQFQSR